MIILGIDPGSQRIGFGVIEKTQGHLALIDAGILKVRKGTPPASLVDIRNHLTKLITKFHPDILGIEKLFFAKNKKTALSVAEARGVILLTAAEKEITIKEYTPTEVKSAIAGHGFADKKAVIKMVKITLRAPEINIIDDAADALAVAILASQKAED